MQIGILGTVSLTVNGRQHEIRAGKVRTLVAVLALEAGQAISHEELAAELWSGRPLRNARNALQAHASRLRRLLDGAGHTPLRSVRNGYLLEIPQDGVDGNRFLDLATQGAAALHDRPAHAAELLTAALRLWRGPALLDAGEGLRCQAAAALFDERRLAAQEDLISARLAVGDERQAIPELRRLVAQHPLRERLSDQLMLALYRSGRQGEALEQFHHTRRFLDQELGLSPGLPLQRRYAAILAHDPELTLPETHAAS
ncbi:BTAD domain-containing putative transcriptional regulator [Actinomadura sp. 9N407]|uniref:AfsR/SARP family transcriptional regulator n=1 Tax=Actinomadura sp. 9N407 TaxID=3375154 RepID=UPI0037BDCA7B